MPPDQSGLDLLQQLSFVSTQTPNGVEMEETMHDFRIDMASIAFACFLAPMALAEGERKLPDGVTILTEQELRKHFVGSTATGGSGDRVWAEYYEPSGRIRAVQGGTPYLGTWTISGPWICFNYGVESDDACSTISLKGDQITYFKENGEPSGSSGNTLIPGEEAAPPPFTTIGRINTNFWGEVAIKGYDPVAYFVDGAARKGSEEFAYEWLGATWHFASAKHHDLFIEDPIRYAPQYGGHCSNGMVGGGTAGTDPEAWSIVDGKLYLFFSKGALARWEVDKRAKIQQANASWPNVLANLEQ